MQANREEDGEPTTAAHTPPQSTSQQPFEAQSVPSISCTFDHNCSPTDKQ
jgi:hypothetical protein